jgi:acetyl esterase
MLSKLELDPRVDPRIKKAFANLVSAPRPNVASREELLAQELSPEGRAAYAKQVALFDMMDREDIAPSAGLTVRTETLTSAPVFFHGIGALTHMWNGPTGKGLVEA